MSVFSASASVDFDVLQRRITVRLIRGRWHDTERFVRFSIAIRLALNLQGFVALVTSDTRALHKQRWFSAVFGMAPQ